MTTTADFGIPFFPAATAQPDVAINEIVVLLQALMCGVKTVGDNAPPGSPTVGDAYVIGTVPTGAWAGRASCIGYYSSGGWRFVPDLDNSGTPITMGSRQAGLRTWNQFNDTAYVWDGSAWVTM